MIISIYVVYLWPSYVISSNWKELDVWTQLKASDEGEVGGWDSFMLLSFFTRVDISFHSA